MSSSARRLGRRVRFGPNWLPSWDCGSVRWPVCTELGFEHDWQPASQSSRSAGQSPTLAYDPLATLAVDQVLRCYNPAVDWLWFYDIDANGTVWKYHEREDFEAETVPRTVAAETVAFGEVESTEISRAHLDVRTGEL